MKHCLLILPTGQLRRDNDILIDAWKPALLEALLTASKAPYTTLDIAAACPEVAGVHDTRNQVYLAFQARLAAVYSVCSHICAEQGIDLIDAGSIDLHVLLFKWEETTGSSVATGSSGGPVFPLNCLLTSDRPWEVIAFTKCKAGEELLHQFMMKRHPTHSFEAVHVPVGSTAEQVGELIPITEARRPERHTTVAVGGTFDSLHEGHKILLSAAALVLEPGKGSDPPPRRLIVGVTGDQLLVNKKFADALEPWEQRQLSTFRFLRDIISLHAPATAVQRIDRRDEPGPNGRAVIYHLTGHVMIECVEIQDPFGPTITDESVTAIVVSAETRSGGQAVNDRRTEKGWAPLEVFEVDVLGPANSSDLQYKMSSTERRRQKLERRGR